MVCNSGKLEVKAEKLQSTTFFFSDATKGNPKVPVLLPGEMLKRLYLSDCVRTFLLFHRLYRTFVLMSYFKSSCPSY